MCANHKLGDLEFLIKSKTLLYDYLIISTMSKLFDIQCVQR